MSGVAELLHRPGLAGTYAYGSRITVLVRGDIDGGIHLPMSKSGSVGRRSGYMIHSVAGDDVSHR